MASVILGKWSPIGALGAAILGVSKDTVTSHQKFKAKYELPFPLLSDTEGAVLTAYDVLKDKTMYGRTYKGIERSTFLIDEDGRVAKVYHKVRVKGHVDQVLEDLA